MENDRSTIKSTMSNRVSATRERLLETTEELIYRHGINATGMDRIVKSSGVSRKSIYKYFATKEALVAEVLKRRDRRWMEWFIFEVEKAPAPEDRLLNMFTVLTGWFRSEGFRGCAFINTAGETGDADDPVRLVAKEHKESLLDYIRQICTEYGATDPDALANRFLILIDGSITVAHLLGDTAAAENAREIARTLLDR